MFDAYEQFYGNRSSVTTRMAIRDLTDCDRVLISGMEHRKIGEEWFVRFVTPANPSPTWVHEDEWNRNLEAKTYEDEPAVGRAA